MSVTAHASRSVIAAFVALVACGPHTSSTDNAPPPATQATVRDNPRGVRYDATIRRTMA